MKELTSTPITDKETQLSPADAIGTQDLEMFKNPDISSILNELLNTDKDKIALSTNIDKKRTLNAIVAMKTMSRNTRTLFRNVLDNDIQQLIESDAQMIEHQIEDKLQAHKALKGYTTNKIIEAITARISRMDKLRSRLTQNRQATTQQEAL